MKLQTINGQKARLTWDKPAINETEIFGYAIEYSIGDERQEPILLDIRHEYTFTGLPSGQSLTTAVRAVPSRYLFEERGLAGPLSENVGAVLPGER